MDAKAFSRQRVLTFPVLVAFLLCAFKGSLQVLLDELFEALTGENGRAVTKSGLSQARLKLKHSAFIALNDHVLPLLESHWPEPRWRSFRLVAADATVLRLPNNPRTQAEFGVQVDRHGQSSVMARALGLYSTASGRMLKANLSGYHGGERELLLPLLPALQPDDLLLLDRGFPSVWLFALLQRQRRPFLARIDGGQWAEVTAFAGSGLGDQVITRAVGRDTRRAARAVGVDNLPDTVTFRLIRVRLENGSEQILATSLLDTENYPAADFAGLYHARWSIEEAFKCLKQRLTVEQFSGESPEAIRQDFYAKLLTANLAEAFAHSVQQTLPEHKAGRYQPNLTYTLARLRLRLFAWLLNRLGPDELSTLLDLIAKTLERKRPGRSAPRPKSRPNLKPRRQYK